MAVCILLWLCWISRATVDVEGALKRMDTEWARVQEMFNEQIQSPHKGTRETFNPSHTLAHVLNPINRVHARKVISELTLPAQKRLVELAGKALARQFQKNWTRIRRQLDQEAERFYVVSPEMLKPIREKRDEMKQYIREESPDEIPPEIFNEYHSSVVKILIPLVRRPWKTDQKHVNVAFGFFDELIEEALHFSNYNGAAIVRLLDKIEDSLLRFTGIVLPEIVANTFAFVDNQLELLKDAV